MKLFNNFMLIVTILILSISCKNIAQYSADMEVTQNDETKVMKLFVKQPYYRMDISEEGQQMYVIVNNKDKTTLMVMPAQKTYMEMSTAGMQGQDDIFKQIEKEKSKYDTKVVGKETVNGYECDKYEIRDKDKLISTFWQSPKFEFPIKAISEEGEKTTMELKNIKEGNIDSNLFEVPSDFNKMKIPGMK